MKKLKWFYHRLKAMSIGEVLYRIEEKKKKKTYKSKYLRSKSILDIGNIELENLDTVNQRIEEVFDLINVKNYEIESNLKIYDSVYDIFGKFDWHRGKKGTWPKDKSSFDIEFKDREDIGDVRFTWEINRHLFFPNLALQYSCLNKEEAYEKLRCHFYDWIKQNPFLKGVNWSSPMEIAIRSYQWLITYSQIKDKMDQQFKKDMLKAIVNSIDYVANNFSRFSSANNHLIVEAAITSIVGYCLAPICNQQWFKKGYEILEKEIPIQVYEDGVNKEQAAHYHSFVLDIMLQYNFFLRKIKRKPVHEKIIFKMAEFIGQIYQMGNIPEFGDSDDAKIVQLDGKNKDYYLYVLQLASIYYKKQLVAIDKVFIEVKFVCGKLFENSFYCDVYTYKNFKVYDKGGYGIINDKENFLMFDVGELGFKSIAAHGHADALSLIYYYKKNPILVDVGTYIYNVEKKWRNYFRKTSNHNTVTQNGKSQSKMEGAFLWSKKARAKLNDFGENRSLIYMCGEHDGYKPDIHKRAITYVKEQEMIMIEDTFSGIGELNYIFDNKVKLDKVDQTTLKIQVNEEILYFCFSMPFKIVEKYISKSFLTKEKTLGLKINNNFDINSKVYSVISKEKAIIKENKFIFGDKKYIYESYKDIRGEKNENC